MKRFNLFPGADDSLTLESWIELPDERKRARPRQRHIYQDCDVTVTFFRTATELKRNF